VTFASVSRNLADSGINVTLSNVYTVMNTSFTRTPATEWTTTIRLGIWASLVAAIAAVTLGTAMPEPVVIIGIILGASLLSWRQLERGTAQPRSRAGATRH
jgi:hypothetical protein